MDRRRPLGHLTNGQLRRFAQLADEILGLEIERVQLADPKFRLALRDALAAEAEIEARKNR